MGVPLGASPYLLGSDRLPDPAWHGHGRTRRRPDSRRPRAPRRGRSRAGASGKDAAWSCHVAIAVFDAAEQWTVPGPGFRVPAGAELPAVYRYLATWSGPVVEVPCTRSTSPFPRPVSLFLDLPLASRAPRPGLVLSARPRLPRHICCRDFPIHCPWRRCVPSTSRTSWSTRGCGRPAAGRGSAPLMDRTSVCFSRFPKPFRRRRRISIWATSVSIVSPLPRPPTPPARPAERSIEAPPLSLRTRVRVSLAFATGISPPRGAR